VCESPVKVRLSNHQSLTRSNHPFDFITWSRDHQIHSRDFTLSFSWPVVTQSLPPTNRPLHLHLHVQLLGRHAVTDWAHCNNGLFTNKYYIHIVWNLEDNIFVKCPIWHVIQWIAPSKLLDGHSASLYSAVLVEHRKTRIDYVPDGHNTGTVLFLPVHQYMVLCEIWN